MNYVPCAAPNKLCMCLRPFSSRGQRRNIIAARGKLNSVCAMVCFPVLMCLTAVQLMKEKLKYLKRHEQLTLLWDLLCFELSLCSYRTPSRYIWTQIWPQTANTSRWQRTSQTAGRRTSLPDRTRQVSVFCHSHEHQTQLGNIKYEMNQVRLI